MDPAMQIVCDFLASSDADGADGTGEGKVLVLLLAGRTAATPEYQLVRYLVPRASPAHQLILPTQQKHDKSKNHSNQS